MRVLVIANPVSGGGQGVMLAQRLARACEEQGLEVETLLTRQRGDACRAAANPAADCLAVVGGDGTVNEVLNGLRGAPVPLAILPAGTANVVSRELDTRQTPARVVEAIAAGAVRAVDVGLCGDRRFLLGAGAGLDAAVVKRVQESRGKRSSLFKWVLPSLSVAMSYAYPQFRVWVDGDLVSERAQYAVAGNCRHSAGVFQVTPKARLDDGLLDVCCFEDLGLFREARLLLGVLRKGFADRDDLHYRQGAHIRMEPLGEELPPLQIDGDAAGTLPAEFTVAPGGVHIVCPQKDGQ